MLGILLGPVSPVLQVQTAHAQTATTPTYYYFVIDFTLNGDSHTYNSQGYNDMDACNAGLTEKLTIAQNTSGIANIKTTPCHGVQGSQTQGGSFDSIGLSQYLRSCGVVSGSVVGCFIQLFYFILVTVPSWLLALTARLFNYMAALTLSDTMYRADFISTIWKIVRDFANIFFIIILLYAAFSVILGLGHGGGRRIVANVIVIALLVNFSLFVSKVIIDSSNILGLIFYNKIDCVQTNGEACPPDETSNPGATGIQEKNLSGALVSTFNINNFFNADFFKGLENDPSNWRNADRVGTQYDTGSNGTLDNALAFSLEVTYGMVIYPLAWIFLITSLSFLGRMIQLMLLMIVSPLAFVTASVPSFRNINTIGFGSWISQLMSASFSAAVFMAILYLVAEIMNANIFGNTAGANLDVTQKLLLIFIPALLIIIFLKKGSDYAKKASGQFTSMVLSGAKVLGGLALGGLAVGAAATASAGRQTFGSVAKYVQNDTSRRDSLRFKDTTKAWNKVRRNPYNPFNYLNAGRQAIKGSGKFLAAGVAAGIQKIPTGRNDQGQARSLGQRMQDSEKSLNKSTTSISKLNAKAVHEFGGKGKYDKDVTFKDLNEEEQIEVRKEIDKDSVAQAKGYTNFEGVRDPQVKRQINEDVGNAYHAYEHMVQANDPQAESTLNGRLSALGVTNPDKTSGKMIEYAKASKLVGEFVTSLRRGTYDIRNIQNAPTITKGIVGTAGILTGMGHGLSLLKATGLNIAGIQGGLRAGLKNSAIGSGHFGASKKDFLSDLGEILTGALSKVKLKVDLKTSGGGGDSHGGGGGGGHH